MTELKKTYNIKTRWTKFEIGLIIISVSLVSVSAIIIKAGFLTPLCSIVGIITALLLAKGKNLGQLLGIVLVFLYSILSYNNKFYGEVIIYLAVMFPMYSIGVITWFKNSNKKTNSVKVGSISKKEVVLLFPISAMCFVGIYFLLNAFNTSELLVSSFSVVDSLIAVYLQIRRSKYSFCFYIINDIILIVLWGIPCIFGTTVLVPMLLNPIINLINDVYGVINWRKLELIQNTV